MPSAITVSELLADPDAAPPVVPLWPTAGQALGLDRTTVYALNARGDFPVRVIRVGTHYRVPTRELLRLLGIELRPETPVAACDSTSAEV
ncbi:helix-turn-helix domain-containing protein [Williamsia sp. 1135]|uniref:helix-turn-helix domain-containing protein n=1 Tax=Williamsia sp. 1135 TaxID=1889262 RepID=UPI000A10CCC2|nr:helix-turn-helix domain-containing protein [Williamsia sp. 1135]ORM25190.1 hypothetical protein BFL43_26080 [Williamsia sp. 1135]